MEVDMIDVTVRVQDDEQTLIQKFFVHQEGLKLSHDDPDLTKMVDATIAKFKGTPTDVLVKIKYTW